MSTITTASPALTPFTAAFEGRVHRAYRDAGGVITIGNGFTGLSRVFDAYWRQARGHRLRLGDTITDAECDRLLGMLLAEEYAPPVARRFAGVALSQHAFDAATDVAFNCGARSLAWRWATSLAEGAVQTAGERLRATAVTAGGRTLAGLVRRRACEARLMESGDYGPSPGQAGGPVGNGQSGGDVRACQSQLATLGFYTGAIDGVGGPLTDGAVRNFQRANGLVVDGIAGPATRAALRRAVEARTMARASGSGATTAGAAGAGTELANDPGAFDWQSLLTAAGWALVVGAAILAGLLIWRWRGVILGRRTPA